MFYLSLTPESACANWVFRFSTLAYSEKGLSFMMTIPTATVPFFHHF